MLKFISKLVGSKSDRDLKKLQPFVDAVNSYTDSIESLSNDALRQKTLDFRSAIENATSSLEAQKTSLFEQIEATENYDAREPLYEQTEALDAEVLTEIERVLLARVCRKVDANLATKSLCSELGSARTAWNYKRLAR